MIEGDDRVAMADAVAAKRRIVNGYVAARDALDTALLPLAPDAECGGWTVAEIAAHVAAWEERSASLIELLAGGCESPSVDVEAFNAAAADWARSAGPEAAVQRYRRARTSLTGALLVTPPAAFLRPSVRDQVAMEREHSREHAAELRALADPEVRAMGQTLDEMIERYRGARDTLEEAVGAHPDARTGDWTGREVLMHVSGWDRYAVEWVPRLAGGEREDPYDEDAMNASFVEARHEFSEDELRADYAAAGDAFVEMLRTLPASALAKGAPGEDWATGLADHALEHAVVFGDIGS